MTVVNFNVGTSSADILCDTLVTREDRPVAWASKVHLLASQYVAIMSRGPSFFSYLGVDQLEQSHLPDGLDSAVPERFPGILRDLWDKALEYHDEAAITVQVFMIGWSKSRKAFAAYKFLPPEFEAVEMDPGYHAVPGPADQPFYHRPEAVPLGKMIQVAKLQKRLVNDEAGHFCIGGDLMRFVITTSGISVAKVFRFDDFDEMARMMAA